MRTIPALMIALAMTTPYVGASHHASHVGTCETIVGSPHTTRASIAGLGVDGIDGCVFDVSAFNGGSSTLSTVGCDPFSCPGIRQDVDVWFYQDTARVSGGCTTGAPNESCTIPYGATTAHVLVYTGTLVKIDVYVT